ncbi:MAG: YncE family protein [Thermoplasmata archaeon]|nr:YncE family protein [Thermoplasmata archaeon]
MRTSAGTFIHAPSGMAAPGSPRAASLYPEIFTEVGLPSGSLWNATLNGQTQSGVAPSSIVFSEPNGTYAYTITGPSDWQLVQPAATGTVHVAGAPNTVVVPSIGVGFAPYGIVYDRSNGDLYVANAGSNSVTVIDGATNQVVVPSVGVGNSPREIAYDASNGDVYVANAGSNDVTVIDGATNQVVVPSIGVGTAPFGIVYDASNGNLYVTNSVSNNMTVINGATNQVVVRSLGVGSAPYGIEYDQSNGFLYVANAGSSNVTVIDGATNQVVVPSIGAGSGPNGIAYDPSNGDLYVANAGSNNVTVIDGATNQVVVPSIGVGTGPDEIAYDPSNGYLYVTNVNSQNVVAIDGAPDRVVGPSLGVGNGPIGIAFDPSNGYLYVANFGSSNVTGIDGNGLMASGWKVAPKYPVTFTETGLPSGTIWLVTLHGMTGGSAATMIKFQEPNGTYTFTIAPLAGSTAAMYRGSVLVQGGPAGVAVAWTPATYIVTFTETGLPSGTSWSVTVNGAPQNSTSYTITLAEPNGTYVYTIGSVSGYAVAPISGSVTVKGFDVTPSVMFSRVPLSPSPGLLGLPGAEGYFLLGGLAAVGVTGAVLGLLLGRRQARVR